MANRTILGARVNWTNALLVAGIAIIAPYFIRRLMPLLDGRINNATSDDVALAGKDSLRDVADDLDVGGISGKLNRTVDRVADRLEH